ncbi:MAG: dephospho-CoA kinase [Phocaeicola sp.]
MIKFAVTGGIGSGKSYVSHLLGLMGIPIYCSDVEAKRLMVEDVVIKESLVALLGEEVYLDGALNKPLLGAYLFSDPLHLKQINAIVHPRVRADFEEWVHRLAHLPIVGLESAILYESGFDNLVDAVALVYAPLPLRLKRTMKRDNLTQEQVLARIAVQMDEAEKRKRAHFVLLNEPETALLPQLESFVEALKKRK